MAGQQASHDRQRRVGAASRGHSLDEAARLLEAHLLVDVTSRAVGGVDVEHDEVAAAHEMRHDGGSDSRAETMVAKVGVRVNVADNGRTLFARVDVRPGGGNEPAAMVGAEVDALFDLTARVSRAFLVVETVELDGVGRGQASRHGDVGRRVELRLVQLHAQHGLWAPEVVTGEDALDVLDFAGKEGLLRPGVQTEQRLHQRRVPHGQSRRAETTTSVHDEGAMIA